MGVADDPAALVLVALEAVVFPGNGGFEVVALPGSVVELPSFPSSPFAVEVAEVDEVVGVAATAGVEIDFELTDRDRVREFETCD